MRCLYKCCCCKLRTGVITIGVLGLIFPCISLGGLLYSISKIAHGGQHLKDWVGNVTASVASSSELGKGVGKGATTIINFVVGGGIALIVIAAFVCLFFIIMNALLVHGARLKKAGYLIPWLIYTAIPIILVAAQLIYFGVLYSGSGASSDMANSTTATPPVEDHNVIHKLKEELNMKENAKKAWALFCKILFFGDFVSSITFIIINGFLFCCVFSFRQEILEGS